MKGPPAPPVEFESVQQMLQAAATDASGIVFLDGKEQEQRFTWAEVRNRAQKTAGALAALGVRRGDKVAIVLPTAPGFLDAFFGTLLAGAVPVPLYPPLRLKRLDEYHVSTARMLDRVHALAVVTDERIRLLLGPSVERARPTLGIHTVKSLLDAGSSALSLDSRAQDPALIQFSSGSTVEPKPVRLSHANLLSQCAALKVLFPVTENERRVGVSWLPLYHDMGLIGALLLAVYYPATLVLLRPEMFLVRPALWLRAISRYRATASAAPSFAYSLCAKRISDAELEGIDLSCWKFALNGAEPISPSAVEKFNQRFGRYGFSPDAMMPVYGLSEASLAVTFTPKRHMLRQSNAQNSPHARSWVSVGLPIPGAEVEVRDENGRSLPENVEGHIWVRGPSVMEGYEGEREMAESSGTNGWLDTGDLGFFSEGELHLCGRAKEVIIVRGANHSPQEFEDCLEGMEQVRPGGVAALGFVAEDGQEQLLVLAECKADADPSLAGLIQNAILERTGVRAHTIELLTPGTLPRTSSGKLRRSEALRRYLAGELQASSDKSFAHVASEVARSVWSSLRTKTPP